MEKTPVQHIAITLDDGSLAIMSFVLEGRSPSLPFGAASNEDGSWSRKATKENIDNEIERSGMKPTKYRLIDESEIPTDRSNRADWKDDGETIG